MSDSLELKLAVQTLPVTLVDATGKSTSYELREMMAGVRDKYLDQLSSRMETDAAGKVISVKRMDGLQAALLSGCLFDSEGKAVPKEVIQSWPGGTVAALFQAAQKLNQLNVSKGEDPPEKKD